MTERERWQGILNRARSWGADHRGRPTSRDHGVYGNYNIRVSTARMTWTLWLVTGLPANWRSPRPLDVPNELLDVSPGG